MDHFGLVGNVTCEASIQSPNIKYGSKITVRSRHVYTNEMEAELNSANSFIKHGFKTEYTFLDVQQSDLQQIRKSRVMSTVGLFVATFGSESIGNGTVFRWNKLSNH